MFYIAGTSISIKVQRAENKPASYLLGIKQNGEKWGVRRQYSDFRKFRNFGLKKLKKEPDEVSQRFYVEWIRQAFPSRSSVKSMEEQAKELNYFMQSFLSELKFYQNEYDKGTLKAKSLCEELSDVFAKFLKVEHHKRSKEAKLKKKKGTKAALGLSPVLSSCSEHTMSPVLSSCSEHTMSPVLSSASEHTMSPVLSSCSEHTISPFDKDEQSCEYVSPVMNTMQTSPKKKISSNRKNRQLVHAPSNVSSTTSVQSLERKLKQMYTQDGVGSNSTNVTSNGSTDSTASVDMSQVEYEFTKVVSVEEAGILIRYMDRLLSKALTRTPGCYRISSDNVFQLNAKEFYESVEETFPSMPSVLIQLFKTSSGAWHVPKRIRKYLQRKWQYFSAPTRDSTIIQDDSSDAGSDFELNHVKQAKGLLKDAFTADQIGELEQMEADGLAGKDQMTRLRRQFAHEKQIAHRMSNESSNYSCDSSSEASSEDDLDDSKSSEDEQDLLFQLRVREQNARRQDLQSRSKKYQKDHQTAVARARTYSDV